MRVCAEPGCPEITSTTRCAAHTRETDRQRGSRQQRGYGAEHQRAGDAAIAGATRCGTCGQPFTPENPVTRGHVKDVRAGGSPSDGYIAQCRRCNYGWRRRS